MNRRYIILIPFLTSVLVSHAQSLIENGDFEEKSSVPTGVSQWWKCTGWTNLNGQTTGGLFGSPDYFHLNGYLTGQMPNTPMAHVMPHSGKAVMGFYALILGQNYREYISTKFLNPMIVGSTYSISFWLTNGNSNHNQGLSCNHIGIKFSTDPLVQYGYEPLVGAPQIEIEGEVWDTTWREHSFTFIADSAYNYLTIGNFYPDDSMSSTPHPANQNIGAYYFIDGMVTECNYGECDRQSNFEMPNVFTPNADGINDYFLPIYMYNIARAEIVIMNRWGEKVFESSDFINSGWNGKCNGIDCSDGVYFWKIIYTDIFKAQHNIHGFVSVSR